MPLPDDSIVPISPQRLQDVLRVVHEQVAVALWLSAGMILAVGAIACIAFGRRRMALIFGFLYSVSLCFVHNGHAQILGPAGCALASTGLFWPRERSIKDGPSGSRQHR
jgi:hypothetical protein